jgi:hypothetical protein
VVSGAVNSPVWNRGPKIPETAVQKRTKELSST